MGGNKQLRRKVRGSYAISTVSIALVLFLVASVGYIIWNLSKATDNIKERMTIRVHLSSKGHPVFGDTVYGGGKSKFEEQNAKLVAGQCLHARTIGFVHPRSGEELYFESELPEYFKTLLGKLEDSKI